MTLWFVAATGATLALCACVSYVVVSTRTMNEVDRKLVAAARVVKSDILSLGDPRLAVENGLIALPHASLTQSPFYYQIVRGNGSICARSHNLGSERLPLEVDVMALTLQGQAVMRTVAVEDGSRIRVVNLPLVVSNRVIGVVQVGYSLRDLDNALGTLMWGLAIGMLVALVTAVAAGWGLARMTMRPIEALREGVARIVGAGDLQQRLRQPERMDSVGQLVSSINALLDRVAQVVGAHERLGADVSHELRTPLTTIRGNVDLLRLGAVDDPVERAMALDAIEVEVNRMSRLVADLLLAAQADAGMKLEKQPVEMDTLLLQVYRQAQTMAAVGSSGGERVSVRLGHEDQAVVMGDPDRLRQLLLNLVDNALKYTPRDGTVTLALHRLNGWVRVTVRDTGVGIPPDMIPRIFDRFYRAPQLGRKGVGLGLAIARWIAEAHDGRLEVESEVGRGSTFSLWLPEAKINSV
jgi:two-component system OmpR family sensor kinase